MSNQTDHTIVRLRVPPELKQKIEESAEKNNRSQSAEMVARLEQSFELSERQAVIEQNHLNNIMTASANVEVLENLMLEMKKNKAIQEELLKTQQHLSQLLSKKLKDIQEK
ncbi:MULTISPECIES: Arc family DNA-binding protein [Acinetobacter]|uniref:Arc family DNA-binding protein n=1 Tax=Acinetobacter TaxID=469 RepID=UPI001F23D02B|nr:MULTISPECIES: Arc family DNA-binding protein [Acinetobacter]MCU4322213.1 Arc family DNA-binding protein [Acinetobacter schindleri]UIJ76957.1 Arc family DNA-binding protein [Acinetobacter sp. SH20PTE14]UIJ77020.1 Arc family DNA-binding protein [Acinetobacter sp. SH20PTE14]